MANGVGDFLVNFATGDPSAATNLALRRQALSQQKQLFPLALQEQQVRVQTLQEKLSELQKTPEERARELATIIRVIGEEFGVDVSEDEAKTIIESNKVATKFANKEMASIGVLRGSVSQAIRDLETQGIDISRAEERQLVDFLTEQGATHLPLDQVQDAAAGALFQLATNKALGNAPEALEPIPNPLAREQFSLAGTRGGVGRLFDFLNQTVEGALRQGFPAISMTPPTARVPDPQGFIEQARQISSQFPGGAATNPFQGIPFDFGTTPSVLPPTPTQSVEDVLRRRALRPFIPARE
jgi:hypothetical protein